MSKEYSGSDMYSSSFFEDLLLLLLPFSLWLDFLISFDEEDCVDPTLFAFEVDDDEDILRLREDVCPPLDDDTLVDALIFFFFRPALFDDDLRFDGFFLVSELSATSDVMDIFDSL